MKSSKKIHAELFDTSSYLEVDNFVVLIKIKSCLADDQEFVSADDVIEGIMDVLPLNTK